MEWPRLHLPQIRNPRKNGRQSSRRNSFGFLGRKEQSKKIVKNYVFFFIFLFLYPFWLYHVGCIPKLNPVAIYSIGFVDYFFLVKDASFKPTCACTLQLFVESLLMGFYRIGLITCFGVVSFGCTFHLFPAWGPVPFCNDLFSILS